MNTEIAAQIRYVIEDRQCLSTFEDMLKGKKEEFEANNRLLLLSINDAKAHLAACEAKLREIALAEYERTNGL